MKYFKFFSRFIQNRSKFKKGQEKAKLFYFWQTFSKRPNLADLAKGQMATLRVVYLSAIVTFSKNINENFFNL